MGFYQRFEIFCEKKGISPTRAAKDNGITQQAVSLWKQRGSTPKADTLRKLADYFGVSVDSLVPPEYPPFPENLAEVFLNGSTATNLRALREAKSMSQKELAERTGIEVKYIRNYEDENSVFFPTEDDLQRLADVFRVDPKYILGKGISQNVLLYNYSENLKRQMEETMNKLNIAGMEEAVRRVEEMTELPRYQAKKEQK